LEFNVPFQHKYGYIRDETTEIRQGKKRKEKEKTRQNYNVRISYAGRP